MTVPSQLLPLILLLLALPALCQPPPLEFSILSPTAGPTNHALTVVPITASLTPLPPTTPPSSSTLTSPLPTQLCAHITIEPSTIYCSPGIVTPGTINAGSIYKPPHSTNITVTVYLKPHSPTTPLSYPYDPAVGLANENVLALATTQFSVILSERQTTNLENGLIHASNRNNEGFTTEDRTA